MQNNYKNNNYKNNNDKIIITHPKKRKKKSKRLSRINSINVDSINKVNSVNNVKNNTGAAKEHKTSSKRSSPQKYSHLQNKVSNRNRKTRKKRYYPKINVIFDIDETLIHSKSVEIPENGDKYLQQIESDKKDIMFLKLSPNHMYIVYKRPYYKQLLAYCYKKFNVSFWTAGTPPYCVGVLKKLLTPEQFNKTHIMFSRKDTKSTYDCKKNYLIKHKSVNGHYPKLLHILWHHPNYKTKFTPNNTILLDNSSVHTSRYPKNTLKVPDFYPSEKEFNNTNSNDVYLRKLLNWLKKHRLVSRVHKLTQSRHLI